MDKRLKIIGASFIAVIFLGLVTVISLQSSELKREKHYKEISDIKEEASLRERVKVKEELDEITQEVMVLLESYSHSEEKASELIKEASNNPKIRKDSLWKSKVKIQMQNTTEVGKHMKNIKTSSRNPDIKEFVRLINNMGNMITEASDTRVRAIESEDIVLLTTGAEDLARAWTYSEDIVNKLNEITIEYNLNSLYEEKSH